MIINKVDPDWRNKVCVKPVTKEEIYKVANNGFFTKNGNFGANDSQQQKPGKQPQQQAPAKQQYSELQANA